MDRETDRKIFMVRLCEQEGVMREKCILVFVFARRKEETNKERKRERNFVWRVYVKARE